MRCVPIKGTVKEEFFCFGESFERGLEGARLLCPSGS